MKRLTTLTLQYHRTLLVYNITFTILCLLLIGLQCFSFLKYFGIIFKNSGSKSFD